MLPDIQAALVEHDLGNEAFLHTNLVASQCICSTRPQPQASLPDGGICFRCGGLTIRTGSCTTCTSCGETGGCG